MDYGTDPRWFKFLITITNELLFSLKDTAKSANSPQKDSDYKPNITTPMVQEEGPFSNEDTPLPIVQEEPVSNEDTPLPMVQEEEPVSNEDAPLMENSASKNPFTDPINTEESIEEQITFADIPMLGLWDKDVAGKNSDRIIILLFILLASMIVVRELVRAVL